MFTLLLLISKMGVLAALLNSTDQTVTVSKNLTEPLNITDVPCGEQCNVTCHLRNKNFDVLPTCLPRTIEDLDLSFNNINIIRDQDVVDLSELRNLSLAHNQIQEIHWKIHVLAKLESLDLSNNQLSSVPKCLMLKNLKLLSLAENPISLIHPHAFSSFPNLLYLNLSITLIGRNSEDINESYVNGTEAQEYPLKLLSILDLSGTFLRNVNHSWIKGLSNLRKLYMRKMIDIEVLEDELTTWFPHLAFLSFSDSSRLSYIRTKIFENVTQLLYLDFTNCNIRDISFLNSRSENIIIDLRGNPLMCTCDLLLSLKKVVLIRLNEVFCTYPKGDVPAVSILELHERCKLSQIQANNETQDSVTSSTAVMESDYIAGTTEDSFNSTLLPHTLGQTYISLENTTDFSTKENDLTTPFSITPSSMVMTDTSPEMNNDFFPNKLTLSIGVNTDSPFTEHKFSESGSSRGDQPDIIPLYQEGYDDDEILPSTTRAGSKMKACDYDHCRHLQTPCPELQLLTQCMCPGLSGDDTLPDPPHVQGVYEITDTSAQILWCSPNSMVEKYQLTYQPEGGTNGTVDDIYVTMRQYTLYNLASYTTYKVCVLAYNKKGHSASTNGASRTPCTEFKTRPSYILILSVLSALGGLFFVTILVLATCLYKACKSNIGSKYDTHLVSYKNPAFEYHCTIPSYH
ncbi:leucine-rich repeat neuronal protein 4 [Hyla sarda]|uniref:leucine-rich repeat neuronal protein 4 n=1 Tax=Hyla sarda TaxID=327740 RepID=UPI0024C41D44|nr:leucine-rich repeat neuronal protein 4 [Hyla sarda]XP_056423809.1 leucine-rich repeat neuronal protein 4 [Hyla sarda]XP_056423810.1 leucine-rich repeat neuronal protein 4 [Hyla sarda]XP_056423811.1 leucine-rich repeat neuronal protein 4 [Hyla sarda]